MNDAIALQRCPCSVALQRCQDLQSTFPDISGCNVFERRGVIERLEGRSGARSGVQRRPEADLGFNKPLARRAQLGGDGLESDGLRVLRVRERANRVGDRVGER